MKNDLVVGQLDVFDGFTSTSQVLFCLCLSPQDYFQNHTKYTIMADRVEFASGDDSGTILLWNGKGASPLVTLSDCSSGVDSLALSSSGRILVSGHRDLMVRIWQLKMGRVGPAALPGHSGNINSVAISRDEKFVASGSNDNTIRLWDVRTHECTAVLADPMGWVASVAFSSDGCTLVSGSGDGKVRMWDVRSGVCVAVLVGHTAEISSVDVSPDGGLVASGSFDRTIRLWNFATRACIATLPDHSSWITSVAFSPAGRLLASSCMDQTLRLWDVDSRASAGVLSSITTCYKLAFSLNGSMLITANRKNTVQLWNVATGSPISPPIAHQHVVRAVASCPVCVGFANFVFLSLTCLLSQLPQWSREEHHLFPAEFRTVVQQLVRGHYCAASVLSTLPMDVLEFVIARLARNPYSFVTRCARRQRRLQQ
jgi:WD40 repeat protein